MRTLTNNQLTLLTLLKAHSSSKAFTLGYYQFSEWKIITFTSFCIVNNLKVDKCSQFSIIFILYRLLKEVQNANTDEQSAHVTYIAQNSFEFKNIRLKISINFLN